MESLHRKGINVIIKEKYFIVKFDGLHIVRFGMRTENPYIPITYQLNGETIDKEVAFRLSP